MEKTKHKCSAVFWLCIALVLCLISAIGASLVQSDFGKVDVQDLRIVVDDGYVINGQIYIPENASAENPVPLVIVSHGSFNNFEMQDLNMLSFLGAVLQSFQVMHIAMVLPALKCYLGMNMRICGILSTMPLLRTLLLTRRK